MTRYLVPALVAIAPFALGWSVAWPFAHRAGRRAAEADQTELAPDWVDVLALHGALRNPRPPKLRPETYQDDEYVARHQRAMAEPVYVPVHTTVGRYWRPQHVRRRLRGELTDWWASTAPRDVHAPVRAAMAGAGRRSWLLDLPEGTS